MLGHTWAYASVHTEVDLCLGFAPDGLFEFVCEGHVVEEGPRVIELAVPGPFQIFHRGDHVIGLFIAYKS